MGYEGEAHTDSQGVAYFRISPALARRALASKVVFAGAPGLLSSSASASLAARPSASPTVLTILPARPIARGQYPRVDILLATVEGMPLADATVRFYVTGSAAQYKRTVQTNPEGIASLVLRRALPPDTYVIQVVYEGQAGFLPASASRNVVIDPPAVTRLTIESENTAASGETIKIIARLTTEAGEPVVEQPILLLWQGKVYRKTRTDADGRVVLTVRESLPSGTYRFDVVYEGGAGLLPTRATHEMAIRPLEIVVRVVPPLAGVEFALDGRTFTSDENGVARIEVGPPGTYRLGVRSYSPPARNIRVRFGRWGDQIFTPYREVTVPPSRTLEIGFEVSYLVSQRFFDLEGRPIPAERIESFTFKSSNGRTVTLPNGEPRWFQAGRVVKRRFGLRETPIQYALMSVMIDGTNVVNQQQQRFYVDPDDVWDIEVLLYSIRISARDALFRFPVGTGVEMVYPNGEVKFVPWEKDGEVVLYSLARGLYRVRVVGVGGVTPLTPVALSRPQEMEMLVITYLDIAVLGTLGGVIAIGLLLFGRPQILAWLRRYVGWPMPLQRDTHPWTMMKRIWSTILTVLLLFSRTR